MTKKISTLLLCAVMIFSIFSLSSCYLLKDSFVGDMFSGSDGNTNITVEGGDTHHITIQGSESSEVLAASKALLSSVSIVCEFRGKLAHSSVTETFYTSGSGVVYKLNKASGVAYIITNYHVVHDEKASTTNQISSKILVMLYGQEYEGYTMEAVYVGGSEEYDIAVLKIVGNSQLISSSVTEAKFADSNDIAVLEKVVAIGNPGGNGLSATVGYINVDSEDIDLDGDDKKEFRVIRTDAAVNHGNSGGGLFNLKGDVVGIVNAKMTNQSVDNIGYAIPSNVAKAIADSIIFYCDGTTDENPKRIMMGITLKPTNLKTEYDVETGKVKRVETVVIEKLGDITYVDDVLFAGDVINSVKIDNVTYNVTRTFHLVDAMLNARVNSKVIMNVTRGGQTMDVEIPLSARMLKEVK